MKSKTNYPSRRILPLLLSGLFFLTGPFWLYWLIHANYGRREWILNGPFPFSEFGSAPVQLLMDIVSVAIGLGLIIRAIYNFASSSRR